MKNLDMKELEKEYGNKTVEECVNLAKSFHANMVEQSEKLVGVLLYLERTKKYKRFNGYAKHDFKTFLSEVCMIPYNRYRQIVWAFNWYPEEARQWGPQTIQTIRERVGVVKARNVIEEVKATLADKEREMAKKAKPKPVDRREIIHSALNKHAPKVVAPAEGKSGENADTKAYWRRKYYDLMDKYNAQSKELAEANRQIAAMRPVVEAWVSVKKNVDEARLVM